MIIVTGSNGFVGKAFTKKLKNSNIHDIFEYDLPGWDILKINNLENVRDVAALVHFAAVANLNDSIRDLDRNFEVNIRGTYEVAKFCTKHGIPLIFISTCCVYGDTPFEENEWSYPNTIEPYACSKMAGEYIIKGMPGLKYTILRIGTVYGPGMRKELFNHIAFEKILEGEPLNVNGDGLQTRNYIYIDDLVEGIYLALTNFKKCDKERINICGKEQVSVRDTIRVVRKLTGKEFVNIDFENKRYGDIYCENIDISKADNILKWAPKITYEEGMKRTYESIIENDFSRCT